MRRHISVIVFLLVVSFATLAGIVLNVDPVGASVTTKVAFWIVFATTVLSVGAALSLIGQLLVQKDLIAVHWGMVWRHGLLLVFGGIILLVLYRLGISFALNAGIAVVLVAGAEFFFRRKRKPSL